MNYAHITHAIIECFTETLTHHTHELVSNSLPFRLSKFCIEVICIYPSLLCVPVCTDTDEIRLFYVIPNMCFGATSLLNFPVLFVVLFLFNAQFALNMCTLQRRLIAVYFYTRRINVVLKLVVVTPGLIGLIRHSSE